MGGERHPDGARTIPATALDLASFPDAQRQLADLSAPLLRDSDVPGHRLFVAAFDGTGNGMFKDAPGITPMWLMSPSRSMISRWPPMGGRAHG